MQIWDENRENLIVSGWLVDKQNMACFKNKNIMEQKSLNNYFKIIILPKSRNLYPFGY